MKKIALFSICTLLLVGNVFATCGQSTLGFDGTQKPKHDEFLYINKNQYDLTVSGYENSNKQNSGSGYGYECDTTHSAGCDKGDEVTLPAGHVFEGNVVNQSVRYVCKGGLNDRWVAQKGTAEACDTKFGQIPVGKQLDGKTTVDCSGLNKTEENVNLVKTWAIICRPGRTVVCKPTECVKDYEVNNKTGKCDFIGCPDCNDKKVNPKPDPKPSKPAKPTTDACEKYKNNSLAYACCKAKDATWNEKAESCDCKGDLVWNGDQCVGKCEHLKSNPEAYACCLAGGQMPGEGKKCKCPEGQVWDWNKDTKTGKCIDNNSTTCTETCELTLKLSVICNNNTNHLSSTQKYKVCKEDWDANALNCDQLKKKVNDCTSADCVKQWLTRLDAFDELIAKVCKPSGAPTPVVVPDNYAKIAAAKQTVSSFFSSAESNKSVWKDAEGNFNTARLASDLTAGVVLGTVGGVVSGVVIKKKQIEKGFDALHCSVGGQTVADWGDIFNVGLRR